MTSRFQTLDDLQTELRELSQSLNKELVDLVNDNYHDFLSLGSTLAGGEEKIEDIRAGLLGFQRDVRGVRDLVDRRREEVQALLQRKKEVRRETGVGRALLEIAERIDLLEQKLNLSKPNGPAVEVEANAGEQWSDEWLEEATINESDDEYDSDERTGIPPRLKRRTDELLILKHLMSRHNPQHPFIVAQEGRIRQLQEILLSDLDMAIRREPEVKLKQQMLQVRAAIAEG